MLQCSAVFLWKFLEVRGAAVYLWIPVEVRRCNSRLSLNFSVEVLLLSAVVDFFSGWCCDPLLSMFFCFFFPLKFPYFTRYSCEDYVGLIFFQTRGHFRGPCCAFRPDPRPGVRLPMPIKPSVAWPVHRRVGYCLHAAHHSPKLCSSVYFCHDSEHDSSAHLPTNPPAEPPTHP